jgi:hypothetical protein
VYVGKGSKWGNPEIVMKANHGRWKVGYKDTKTTKYLFHYYFDTKKEAIQYLVDNFRAMTGMTTHNNYPSIEEIRQELKGKNLVCWCPADKPCHGDVLLELANKEV